MSLRKSYKLDEKKVKEGVEIYLPPNDDGSVPTLIVSRTGRGNERYLKALERTMRPHQAKMRTKTLKNDEADKLLMQAFVEGALIGWKNVLVEDVLSDEELEGVADKTKTMPFSVENAMKLFTNVPELYDDVSVQAADITLFRESDVGEASKN